MKPRVIIMTDISSLESNYREPDDTQSLIRFLLYANELDIEGLIATAYGEYGIKPEYIEEILRHYGEVHGNLLLHDSTYPSEPYLRSLIKRGNTACGMEQLGLAKDSEGSDWIISVLDKQDDRPVWVLVWGGALDLAQAIWKVVNSRSQLEASKIKSKLRVYAIDDQYDGTGTWIRTQHPDVFYILARKMFRGMYKGGDQSLVSKEWVDTNIRIGHGALGTAYPNYDGGDPWGKVRGVKEGDTPSLLHIIPNGLSDPEKPEQGSWGGRFTCTGRHFHEAQVDESLLFMEVARWRPAYQTDFQARLDWCVLGHAQGNHPPTAIVNQPPYVEAYTDDVITLDASASFDPDGDALTFNWSVLRLEDGIWEDITPADGNGHMLTFVVPETEVHIVLSVTDNGMPALTRYSRVVIGISKDVTVP